MTEIDRSVRLLALLDKWFFLFIVVLVILAGASGFWMYQVHAQENVQQQQRTIEEWSETTSYDHSAVIINDSIPFQEGEVVENRPIYYTSLTDELNIDFTYTYSADSGQVKVTTDTSLLIRSVQNEEVLWEYTVPLASNTTPSLEPGETHASRFGVDMRMVLNTLTRVQEQLGTRGQTQVQVVSTTQVTGQVNGDTVENSYDSSMQLSVNPGAFRVQEVSTIDESHERVETVEVNVEPSPIESVGSILVFILILVTTLGMIIARYTGYIGLTEDEQELLEIYQQEQEFGEWITEGTFPSERDYDTTILVDDLEGLVDVAIDTNKRVIKDPQLGVSTVLDGDYVYVYVRPDSPAKDWLMNYADTTLDDLDEGGF